MCFVLVVVVIFLLPALPVHLYEFDWIMSVLCLRQRIGTLVGAYFFKYINIHKPIHAYAHTRILTSILAYLHTYLYICIYIYTRTCKDNLMFSLAEAHCFKLLATCYCCCCNSTFTVKTCRIFAILGSDILPLCGFSFLLSCLCFCCLLISLLLSWATKLPFIAVAVAAPQCSH